MKSFKSYLTENQKTHSYRIKICGDLPDGFLSAFKAALKKFDPESMGEVKKTPVMSRPQDFPAFPNESVSLMDVSFRYPANFQQVQEMAKLLGLDVDRICMVQRDHDEAMDRELMGIADQKDLLTSAYPSDNAEQKAAKKDYAAVGADKQVVKNSAADAAFVVAGGKTPPAETTNDLPMGIKSPMTTIKRPPRPETGFRKQGY
jgi:hypothetical protein